MFEEDKESKHDEVISKKRRKRIIYFWTAIVIIYILIGSAMVYLNYSNKVSAIATQNARMTPNMTEPGLTQADMSLPANATPIPIISGIYVDRISALDLKASSWAVSFYIWFKWNGTANLSDNFTLIDGSITSKQKITSYDNGTQHYRLFLVTGTITKFFDLTRYPLDSHMLTISIEDGDNQRKDIIYVPDNNETDISSRVEIPGYAIGNITTVEKPHSYKSTMGDPRTLVSNDTNTYSQLRTGFDIYRGNLGYFLKIFIGMFIAVGIAFVALLRRPIDSPRFALGGSSLFVAVGNMIITSQYVPNSGQFTLADMVSTLCLITVLICLCESTFSFYLWQFKDERDVSRRLDRISFIILAVSFIVILSSMIYAAW